MRFQRSEMSRAKGRQKGAVLIVSLVVLLVVTLLGVAGMNSSLMQEKMAANAQNSNRTFQAAESSASALTEQLVSGDLSIMEEAMEAADSYSTEATFSIDDPNGISASYQARYLGEIIINSGSSMDANESSTLLKGYRFELRGKASIPATGAGSTIFKGIEYY